MARLWITKRIEVLLLPEDERDISTSLVKRWPNVTFIDDWVLATRFPPLKGSIADCNSPFIHIWDRPIKDLPHSSVSDHSHYWKRQTGGFVSLVRCRVSDMGIRNGTFQAGINPDIPEMHGTLRAFANDVWKVVRKHTHNKLIAVDPGTRAVLNDHVTDLHAGHHATAWLRADPRRYFHTSTVGFYVLPRP